MIGRLRRSQQALELLKRYPVVAIVGARQVGKSTLARQLSRDREAHFFDLEVPTDVARLSAPMHALQNLKGLVVIDEIQRMPELFPILRVLADRDGLRATFLILGSASPHLVKGVSESLAGRIAFLELDGFDLEEVGADKLEQLWLRGGFPDSFLADSDASSLEWRNNLIRTFLERDIPQLGITIPAATLRRFWMMIAHIHGNLWNASELARALGVNQKTAARYLDILTGTFLVRQLQPWFANIKKRQVKSPKIYIRDSGLLHALLTLSSSADLLSHPKLGASWEGFAIEQVLASRPNAQAYFWKTHAGAELDLLLIESGKRLGIEIKYADAPRTTKSMHIALAELELERLFVVYPGETTYSLHDKISVIPLSAVWDGALNPDRGAAVDV